MVGVSVMDLLEFTNYEDELIETYNEELSRLSKFQDKMANHFNYDYYKNVILKFADINKLEVKTYETVDTIKVFNRSVYDSVVGCVVLKGDGWDINRIKGEFYEIEKFKDELEEFESELKKFN